MTAPFSIDSPEFRELLEYHRSSVLQAYHGEMATKTREALIAHIDAKIAAAVKAERDEWIAQLKLLEKKP